MAVVAIEQFQVWQIAGVWWLWPALGLLGMWMIGETYFEDPVDLLAAAESLPVWNADR